MKFNHHLKIVTRKLAIEFSSSSSTVNIFVAPIPKRFPNGFDDRHEKFRKIEKWNYALQFVLTNMCEYREYCECILRFLDWHKNLSSLKATNSIFTLLRNNIVENKDNIGNISMPFYLYYNRSFSYLPGELIVKRPMNLNLYIVRIFPSS